jgi:hypothetical protein
MEKQVLDKIIEMMNGDKEMLVLAILTLRDQCKTEKEFSEIMTSLRLETPRNSFSVMIRLRDAILVPLSGCWMRSTESYLRYHIYDTFIDMMEYPHVRYKTGTGEE